MPERAPARPQGQPSVDVRPGLDFTSPPAADTVEAQFDDDPASSNITVIEDEHAGNPVDADIEQAAVMFANGQENVVRSLLEMAVQNNPGPASERLWRMLLDLLQLQGDRAAFEQLGLEFAAACETSPPAWRGCGGDGPATPAGETLISLPETLNGAEAPDLLRLAAAQDAHQTFRLDLSRLVGCDEGAAAALSDLLGRARKRSVQFSLVGQQSLLDRLAASLQPGRAEGQAMWLLCLELLQRSGDQAAFEEKAIDYAVTFEVSPPSWEEAPKTPPRPCPPVLAESDVVFFLSGELRSCRFHEVAAFIESQTRPVLDFSQVVRLDFASAGMLRNLLEPWRKQGREIIIRHPNHLVAELMHLVGMGEVARIVHNKL